MSWVYNPHAGGVKIRPKLHARIRERIEAHAAKHRAGKFDRLNVRFHGALCYVDAIVDSSPVHLVRLRYFGNDDRWSLAFYTYSHERYEPCAFAEGSFLGSPEDAFDIGAVYLQ
jgi:hypothetical protein